MVKPTENYVLVGDDKKKKKKKWLFFWLFEAMYGVFYDIYMAE